MPIGKTLAWILAAMLLCVCMAESIAAETVEDGELLSIERLHETEFIPASRIANQVSDASSVVSIITAQDIKDYGYCTLAEILNSIRGVNVTQDHQYQFLGGRGYGLPRKYLGCIRLLNVSAAKPAILNLSSKLLKLARQVTSP
jgi:iron complex outermembrane receptor protein